MNCDLRAFDYAAREEAIWKQQLSAMSNYTPQTTFFADFSIAEFLEKEHGVRDTFERSFQGFKNDYIYLTELSLVLNHKIWEWYEKDTELATVYNELWEKVDSYCCDNFEGEEASYYFRVTD